MSSNEQNQVQFKIRLKEIRKSVPKLTQVILAEKVGTDQSVISLIESGKLNPSLNMAMLILQALRSFGATNEDGNLVTLDDLIELEETWVNPTNNSTEARVPA